MQPLIKSSVLHLCGHFLIDPVVHWPSFALVVLLLHSMHDQRACRPFFVGKFMGWSCVIELLGDFLLVADNTFHFYSFKLSNISILLGLVDEMDLSSSVARNHSVQSHHSEKDTINYYHVQH